MKLKTKITLSIIVSALICYGIVSNDKKSSISDNSFIPNQSQSIQLNHSSTSSSIQIQSSTNSPNLNRDEILKKNLKGYREQTYWGNQHSIDEKVNQMDDEEFKEFIEEEIQSNDADVYWGAEY